MVSYRDIYRRTGNRTKQLTNKDLAELASGFTISEIALLHGYTHEGIRRRLKRLGITPKKSYKRRIERSFDIDLLYRDSISLGLSKTAQKHRMNYYRLKSLLPHSSGKVDYRPAKLPSTNEIRELLKSNTVKEIADRFGTKKIAVYQRLRKAGTPISTIMRRNGELLER